MSRFFSVSNAFVCSSVGFYQSGSASFRNVEFNGRAMSEYFCKKRRYTFAAPGKDRNCVTVRVNAAFAKVFELSTAIESLPGVIAWPR